MVLQSLFTMRYIHESCMRCFNPDVNPADESSERDFFYNHIICYEKKKSCQVSPWRRFNTPLYICMPFIISLRGKGVPNLSDWEKEKSLSLAILLGAEKNPMRYLNWQHRGKELLNVIFQLRLSEQSCVIKNRNMRTIDSAWSVCGGKVGESVEWLRWLAKQQKCLQGWAILSQRASCSSTVEIQTESDWIHPQFAPLSLHTPMHRRPLLCLTGSSLDLALALNGGHTFLHITWIFLKKEKKREAK